jgi:hypothetical protein
MTSKPLPAEGDVDLAVLVATARAECPDKRTLPISLPDGGGAWLKVAQSAEVNRWHRLQLFLARLCNNPFLLPTVASQGASSLLGEARRIRKLAGSGFPVPIIIAEGADWLLLADSGYPATTVLRDETHSRQSRKKQLQSISELLAKMHQQGCWHGRPALKDVLCRDDKVTLCDFEEDVGAHLSQLQCQVRDALIYGHSLFRVFCRTDPEMARYGLKVYWNLAPLSVKNAIAEKVASMDVFLGLDVLLGKHLGGDALAVFMSFRYFNQLQRPLVV